MNLGLGSASVYKEKGIGVRDSEREGEGNSNGGSSIQPDAVGWYVGAGSGMRPDAVGRNAGAPTAVSLPPKSRIWLYPRPSSRSPGHTQSLNKMGGIKMQDLGIPCSFIGLTAVPPRGLPHRANPCGYLAVFGGSECCKGSLVQLTGLPVADTFSLLLGKPKRVLTQKLVLMLLKGLAPARRPRTQALGAKTPKMSLGRASGTERRPQG